MQTSENYKSIETSKVNIFRKPNGVRVLELQVETMRGINTQMMVWWFHHFDRMTNWGGRDFDAPARLAYRVWHPRDHISITQLKPGRDPSLGGCAEGATIRIQEKPLCKFNTDSIAHVAQCDEQNLALHKVMGPFKIGHVDHLWRNVDGGCDMMLRFEVGSDLPVIGRFINWIFERIVPDEIFPAVAQHATEEFGNLENFLPQFYANPDKLWKHEGAAYN